MDRKQGIIHLGRSKSPARFQRDVLSARHNRVDSIRTSRTKQPMQEASILNHSMHVSSPQHNIKADPINYSQTYSGFFPPNPQSVQQTVHVKENIRSPERIAIVQQSPSKRVIVSRQVTLENSPCKVSQTAGQSTERQAQLQRKIKVLQSRIQQLHQQKQNCVVKAHQENKRLCIDNSVLQNKLAELQSIKNKQIFGLRQQINSLRCGAQRAEQVQKTQKPIILKSNLGTQEHQLIESSPKSHSALKNAAYVDDQDDTISINNHTYKVDQPISQTAKVKTQNQQIQVQCRQLMEKIKQLQGQNRSLRAELCEMKDSILKTTSVIQQNNKKIVQNYESRIISLLDQLNACKQSTGDASALQQSLALSQTQTEQYVNLLLQKSQQLNRTQKSLQETKKCLQQTKNSLQFSNKQVQDYVTELCKKSQVCNQQQKQLMAAGETLVYNRQQIEQYVSRLLLKDQELLRQEEKYTAKIFDLEDMWQITQQKLREQEEKNKKLQAKETASPDPCPKCRQLIKTLVKLNQKTFSKTS